jgi:hypothetical protein
MINTTESRLVGRICLIMRVCVACSWLAIFITLLLPGVHPGIARGVFTFFRIVAIIATLWLVGEFAEAASDRISFRSPFIDAMLTLPMFIFWLWVYVVTF